MSINRFANRSAAGQALARLVASYAGQPDVVVLGLARGGVPVAAEIARALRAPLDVFVVRKLGVPGHEEVALGAIASGGIRVINRPLVAELGVTPEQLEAITDRERRDLERRERAYRDGRAPIDVHGRTVIVVDDGLATGATMSAAIAALRVNRPRRIVVATPVASHEAVASLRPIADEIVVVATPEPFTAVGIWYDDFTQTSDDEVRDLLAEKTGCNRNTARIPSNGVVLDADLVVPEHASGIVIFAHGSGSGRHSTRNRYVASTLNGAGLATLLLDLLTEREAVEDQHTGHIRFDVELLAHRLGDAARWVREQPMLANLPIAYFGASTGAAAALIAAAHDPQIRAVVSRGGRPDLAGAALSRVRAPTLLIVGGHDVQVLEYNRRALGAMHSQVELIVIPRATHLFEEPGALEEVASVARDWLTSLMTEGATASAESERASAGQRVVA